MQHTEADVLLSTVQWVYVVVESNNLQQNSIINTNLKN